VKFQNGGIVINTENSRHRMACPQSIWLRTY
jgi:hypothetical protein